MRPELMSFSQAMEKRLKEFDEPKGEDGWKTAYTGPLLDRLAAKIADLRRDVLHLDTVQARKVPRQNASEARAELLSSACDVANYAMLVADVCGALPLAEPNPSDILNLRMRSTLEQARSLITIVGSAGDEVQHAMLQEIDEVLARKPVATKNVVRAFAASLTPEERAELLEVLESDHKELEAEHDHADEDIDP